MPKGLSLLLFLGYCTLSQGIFLNPATAQITPDGTLGAESSVVTPDNINSVPTDRIDGGATRGENLFHSFQDFNVNAGRGAFFNNAADIVNIFSRVTGGNISNIDGLLRANGSANLFLLNPAGIIFGPNARLSIGGSFFGSTADSIVFADGEFSALDADNPPLLTINAPIGLNFRDNPGEITVRGDGLGTRATNDLIDTENALRVNSTSTLGFVGNKLNLEGATLKTAGGRIELGSVAGNEQISFNPIDKGFSLDYEGVENFSDIQLSQIATIDASGLVSGDIQVQGNNITLTEGSQIEAGVIGNLPSDLTSGIVEINATASLTLTDGADISVRSSGQGNAGDVTINAFESVSLINGSSIFGTVGKGAVGNGGNITIDTASFSLSDGRISVSTSGEGNGGDITITASETVSLDNVIMGARVSRDARGDGGNITIDTASFSLSDGSISVSTSGEGDAGDITINASESVSLDNSFVTASNISLVFAFGGSDAMGDGGNITIDTASLSLSDGFISVSTSGEGDAGDITIDTASLSLTDGSQITAETRVTGATGEGGNITIDTASLRVSDNADITVESLGLGEAGDLFIQASSIALENGASLLASTPVGTGGNITLQLTEDLTLRDNSLISAEALSEADGGNVNINTRFILAFPSSGDGNDIIASAPQGTGGNINIEAKSIFNLKEREAMPGNGTNDIDVTGAVDGLVTVTTPNVDITRTSIETPQNVVESEQAVGQACQRTRTADQPSGLTIKGKGGIPPVPTEPFMADALIPDGKPITIDKETDLNSLLVGEIKTEPADPHYIPPDIKPIKTSMGDIYPARGIIKTEDGEIILTVYPTDNINTRTPDKSANCNPL